MTNQKSTSFVFVTITRSDIQSFLFIDVILSMSIYFLCKWVFHNELLAISSSITAPILIKKLR
ncbi:hypothetical protein FZC66_10355 [Priestia megaterium]|nr:hypothetical protein FZC66_10355 [Priestia megaterium]